MMESRYGTTRLAAIVCVAGALLLPGSLVPVLGPDGRAIAGPTLDCLGIPATIIVAPSAPADIHGTADSDVILVLDDHDHVISGGPGYDVICGGTGVNTVYGGRGNDVVQGGPQNDTVHGGSGPDEVLGAAGNDTIVGGLGVDRLLGGRGRDDLRAIRDRGGDVLTGGPNFDACSGDVGDLFHRCERVTRG